MPETIDLEREAHRTLRRLLTRIEKQFADSISSNRRGWKQFTTRLDKHFRALFRLYFELYGDRDDFFFHIEDLLVSLARAWFERSNELRALDEAREANPLWFQSNRMLGGVCYVDRFAENLQGVKSKIPYLKELGLTYLHLMPLFKMPEGENDGGYAVSSYREVHPPLGTIEQLASLAHDLRQAGISLALDLVFNHTSDEHTWADRAKAGEEEFMNYYRIFPDRGLPDAFERTLREIFPEEHPGAFSPLSILARRDGDEGPYWVWTTFHSYQWDLNYSNPVVFNRMAEEMLFLANQGVEIIRLDAVAFIWKELGTSCENLPGAHTLIQAFNAVARIASPALLFKSEAIVHPDEVVKYISPEECQLSYNPLLMALLWNSLATRKVRLLSQALAKRFKIHPETSWGNYVRVHDDIGWTFSDEDAALLGVNGNDHRHFLNEFYRGRFPGSFARGLPFQENLKTGDCRISGTCASLAGLEKAITEQGPDEIEFAVRRILLIHGIILTIGGLPLIYLGDEIGTLNDYSYLDDASHARDSRWVHRQKVDWDRYAKRNDTNTMEGRVYQGLQKLIVMRKKHIAFSCGGFEVIETENEHVLGYVRKSEEQRLLVFANFSDHPQTIPYHSMKVEFVRIHGNKCGTASDFSENSITIKPFDFLVLDITMDSRSAQ